MTDRRNVRWECACGAWSTHVCPEPNPTTTTDILDQARAALDVSEHHSYEDHLDSLTEVVPALVAEVERLRAEVVQAWAACEGNGKLADELWAQIGAGVALADQLDREATAPGQYAEIRRSHAARIRRALDGEVADA